MLQLSSTSPILQPHSTSFLPALPRTALAISRPQRTQRTSSNALRRSSVPAPSPLVARGIPVSGPSPSGGGDQQQPSVMNAAPPGQIAASLIASMHEKISQELQTDKVDIADAYGDGRHVSISVVSPLFEGQTSVKRQRMVYKTLAREMEGWQKWLAALPEAIWLELQEAVHAVDSMSTKTPAEAGLA